LNNQVRAGLAIAQFFSGRVDAINDMKEALTNARALSDDYTVAFLSQSLGEAYTQLGEFEQAGSYLSAALEYYHRKTMRPYLARALESLAQFYEKQGRSSDAVQARGEAQTLIQELQLGDNARLAFDQRSSVESADRGR
jgi:tetratricopeptide (TPR) repeat protein